MNKNNGKVMLFETHDFHAYRNHKNIKMVVETILPKKGDVTYSKATFNSTECKYQQSYFICNVFYIEDMIIPSSVRAWYLIGSPNIVGTTSIQIFYHLDHLHSRFTKWNKFVSSEILIHLYNAISNDRIIFVDM